MTQQAIATGTVANDGTGDTLRSAGIKINANFDEVYTYLGKHPFETITADGPASTTTPFTICNKGTALAVSLADADSGGQFKVFTNKGAGIATITPASFAQGTTVALDQYDAVTLVWDENNWYITGHYGATIA